MSQNSQENSCQSLFFNKVPDWVLQLQSGTDFCCEFCEICKDTFFIEHIRFFQNTFNGCFFSFIKFHWLMHTISILFKLLNATAKFRQINYRIERIQTWGSAIFCKFLVGNSSSTEASELRNIDITEFRCLDFSNISLKFLTGQAVRAKRHVKKKAWKRFV